jgi:hypothetical protein
MFMTSYTGQPTARSYRQRSYFCALSLLIAFALTTQHATAEQFAPYDEIKRKSAVFEPQPSFDTAPVTVKVVDVTYRIPRNYLTHLDPAIPTLKLTWPGLKPLTEETRKCFGSILQSEQVGCTSLEFHLLGSRGPAPGGRAFTNAEMFENFMRVSKTNVPRPGPFGTEIYDVGPEDARTEIYRKTEGDIYFNCMIFDNHGKRGAVCADMFRLDDLNHVQFRFRPPQIEHIPEIEAGIRRLMASFVVEGGQR